MSHPFHRLHRPTITAADLSDASKLHGLIDQLLTHDQLYRRHTRKILNDQHRLQELASEDAFLAYLDLEQATNERLNLMLITVARWAFYEGRRDQGDDQ